MTPRSRLSLILAVGWFVLLLGVLVSVAVTCYPPPPGD
ncbi:MAG: hypothetical protein QOJ23_1163 [Actinomycetota bacterium]|jgi:hypothetical protein|nr:hypothetical protein [Actinomycetota bacterium]MDQ1498007.1 hypothetical protein [Actinomycetota bacterium]